MRKEIITIGVGQSGVQVSNAAWELYCMEHGIYADGKFLDSSTQDKESSYKSFFEEANNGSVVPRAIQCDLEITVVDEIRTGAYRTLFHPDGLINGFEDAANNYARGHFTMGKALMPRIMDRLRKIAGSCENLEGFLFVNGYGGGTGSGLTDIIAEKITSEYSKRTRVQCSVFPGAKFSTATVEPYNCLLSVNTSIEHVDVALQFDNDAMYSICQDHLTVQYPTYTHLNRIMSQVLSSLTCAIRFDNYVDADLTQVQTNLVPFPRIHFPVPSYSPFYMSDKVDHQNITVDEITRDVFEGANQLSSCDLSQGKIMSIVLQYRGSCSPQGVNTVVASMKKNSALQFVDWCPTGFKTGICAQPSVCVPGSGMAQTDRSVCCLSNNTAVGTLWKRLFDKFDAMFGKRAFVHHYVGEGMEEGEFLEARDKIAEMCKDYKECGVPSVDENEDMDTSDNAASTKKDEATKQEEEEPAEEEEDNNANSNQNNTVQQTNQRNEEMFGKLAFTLDDEYSSTSSLNDETAVMNLDDVNNEKFEKHFNEGSMAALWASFSMENRFTGTVQE